MKVIKNVVNTVAPLASFKLCNITEGKLANFPCDHDPQITKLKRGEQALIERLKWPKTADS